MVYDKEAELYLAHIRPRPVEEIAPEEPVVPGERDEEIIETPEEEADPPEETPEDPPSDDPSPGGDGGDPLPAPEDPPSDPPQEGSGDD